MTARAATGGGRHPAPLVERDGELACLDGVLHAARSGVGATVVIEGPAGIGKTSLLSSARAKAAESAMTVLQARGSPLEREYAMGLVRQCLERTVRGDRAHEELFVGAARLARAVVLDTSDELGTAPVGVLHGLYWLLANLAERAPLLVAIDDVQWADEPSLRFLAYLTRRVEALPVAIVVCARAGGDVTTEAILAAIKDDPSSEVLRPRPLPLAGVERFLLSGPLRIGARRICCASEAPAPSVWRFSSCTPRRAATSALSPSCGSRLSAPARAAHRALRPPCCAAHSPSPRPPRRELSYCSSSAEPSTPQKAVKPPSTSRRRNAAPSTPSRGGGLSSSSSSPAQEDSRVDVRSGR